jgi:hypothetical protein
LVHFVVIWYIFQFWYVVTRKIWQPWPIIRSNSSLHFVILECTPQNKAIRRV